MKKNFFSAVQGKFDAKYHGRYLGNILEQIAAIRVEVVEPFLKAAPSNGRWPRWSVKNVREVSAEVAYLAEQEQSRRKEEEDGKDRRADLEISLESKSQAGTILIEIKMEDEFLDGQLNEYIEWAKASAQGPEVRAVIVLTAFPLKADEHTQIEENKAFIQHMYLSELFEALCSQAKDSGSDLIPLFCDYLLEEGYAMYQIDEADFKALRSFMVLNFLHINKSGHSKVSSATSISRGPVVFSSLVHNWQLVSNRLKTNLRLRHSPKIHYFPEQIGVSSESLNHIQRGDVLASRIAFGKAKKGGRYWLTASCRLGGKSYLEWGQILEIAPGSRDSKALIQCKLFAILRTSGKQHSGAIEEVEDGVRNQQLYSVDSFLESLHKLVSAACTDTAVPSQIKQLIQTKLEF